MLSRDGTANIIIVDFTVGQRHVSLYIATLYSFDDCVYVAPSVPNCASLSQITGPEVPIGMVGHILERWRGGGSPILHKINHFIV